MPRFIYQNYASYKNRMTENNTKNVTVIVSNIIQQVREKGDEALYQFTEQLDKSKHRQLRVSPKMMQSELAKLDPGLRQVLEEACENVRVFHQKQLQQSQLEFFPDGTVLGWKVSPIDNVGIYVPGGRAVYPSTVIMNVVPALVAKVPRIVVVTPPNTDGLPHPLVSATLALLGVEEVYCVGGAQSIAALAYGTKTIAPVNKITGPGNAYVAEAKKQVYGKVGIDSIAGPSEIMIAWNDFEIPVEYVVRDLLSQAEHDPDARAILLTPNAAKAKAVSKRLAQILPTAPRREIIESSFDQGSGVILVEDWENVWDIVNEEAPEHLEVLTQNAFEDIAKVRNAGAIFIGPHTPESVGDYFAGPNHTLPTMGCAKFASPLGVWDFVKNSSILSYSQERLRKQGASIIKFAEAEGLIAHAEAVRCRLK